MKKIKKIASVMLAMVMVLAMSLTAFAADGQNGETYNAYKIFEASVAKENGIPITDASGKEIVSYTISNSSEWYNIVNIYAEADKGLTLTASAADATKYVVSVDDSFSASDFAAELAKNTTGKNAASNAIAGENITTIAVDGDGYYLITSSLGAITALVTDGSNSVTIVEKNTVPSITKAVRIDEEAWADSTTIDVIDTVDYQLTVNTGTNSADLGTGVNGNYVITDVLPSGFAYVMDTTDSKKVAVAVKVGETAWEENTDYTVSVNDSGNLVVTLLSGGALRSATQNTDIVITYSATVTAANANIGITGNTNTATLTYKNQSATDDAIVYTYEIGGTGEDAPFKKVDGDNNALAGVIFQLSKTVDETIYYAVATNGYLSGWTTDKSNASDLITDVNGAIDVKGLDAGTYTLTETQALPGYNLLKDTITVVISEEGAVTYQLNDGQSQVGNTINVVNLTGSELPSTGGTGTTVLYTIGILLVLGAGILLVVRRRMSVSR